MALLGPFSRPDGEIGAMNQAAKNTNFPLGMYRNKFFLELTSEYVSSVDPPFVYVPICIRTPFHA